MLRNAENQTLRLPPGIKDFLFEEAQQRRDVERLLREMLERKGYREIITPTYEYCDVFSQAAKAGKGQNGLDEKIYRFLDRDGNVLALRVDFTAQIARIAASRFVNMPAPIRIYYSGKVFRAEPHHAGRSREKWEVGFEILGSNDLQDDAEAVFCVLDGLSALGISKARVAIGHIGYFDGLVAQAGVEGEALERLRYFVERKDSAGLAQVTKESSLPAPVRDALTRLPNLHGGGEILSEARRLAANEISRQAVDRLDALLPIIQQHEHSNLVFLDLSEVEGMGYYTGIILRAFAAGVGQAIGSGGRYDDLISRFGAEMPAVGFSFDVDLLVNAVGGST
jgi:ATP phosphoribosyltransferase regulatory subunit